ncbi:hypothetical protein [Jidongwangia harbinensis]|uniref:hypothetical protein n=1 Tax=Jidongwangia harbinensis TaxID=2878561 RepID=UPI001CD9665D|nr:hypothetical protein [Jidongwangia harbinensis]MCA2216024.1 hypothetical protein [Jidongwangia harbinensis]
MQAKGDTGGAEQLQERLAQIDAAIQDVDYRAANIRAGDARASEGIAVAAGGEPSAV